MKTKKKNLKWFIENYKEEINCTLIVLMVLGVFYLFLYVFSSGSRLEIITGNKFQFYTEIYFKTLMFNNADIGIVGIGIIVIFLYITSIMITCLINCYRDKKCKWKSSTWHNFIEICKYWIFSFFTCALIVIVLSLPYYLFLYNSNLMFVGFAVLILLAMFGYAEYKART